jgi:hypothetical protein
MHIHTCTGLLLFSHSLPLSLPLLGLGATGKRRTHSPRGVGCGCAESQPRSTAMTSPYAGTPPNRAGRRRCTRSGPASALHAFTHIVTQAQTHRHRDTGTRRETEGRAGTHTQTGTGRGAKEEGPVSRGLLLRISACIACACACISLCVCVLVLLSVRARVPVGIALREKARPAWVAGYASGVSRSCASRTNKSDRHCDRASSALPRPTYRVREKGMIRQNKCATASVCVCGCGCMCVCVCVCVCVRALCLRLSMSVCAYMCTSMCVFVLLCVVYVSRRVCVSLCVSV